MMNSTPNIRPCLWSSAIHAFRACRVRAILKERPFPAARRIPCGLTAKGRTRLRAAERRLDGRQRMTFMWIERSQPVATGGN